MTREWVRTISFIPERQRLRSPLYFLLSMVILVAYRDIPFNVLSNNHFPLPLSLSLSHFSFVLLIYHTHWRQWRNSRCSCRTAQSVHSNNFCLIHVDFLWFMSYQSNKLYKRILSFNYCICHRNGAERIKKMLR